MNKPKYTITDDINNKCIEITDQIARMKISESFKPRLTLRKESNIRSVNSSLLIEGVDYSVDEVTDIVNGKRVVGDIEDINAVKNTYDVYSTMETRSPHSIEDFIDVQKTMMKGVIPESDSGLRKVSVGVYDGSLDMFIYEAPKPELVESMVKSLFEWFDLTYAHPLISSAIMHFQIEHIHPFVDGNGRTGRFWHTLILSKWDKIFLRIPIESSIRNHQSEYYEVINRCNRGDCTEFIDFSLSIILESLDNAKKLGTDDRIARLVSVMAKGKEYSANELLYMMDLKDSGKFKINYIDKAIAKNAIEMCDPNNPRSKNQRYRLVTKR